MSTSRFTVAEYFAGIGLMRLGLDQAGWQTLFANDIDEKKHEMYCGHFGSSPEFVLGDIHGLKQADVPSTVLATASFPCNDLAFKLGVRHTPHIVQDIFLSFRSE